VSDASVDALVQASFLVQRVLADVARQHEIPVSVLRLGGILRDRTPSMADVAAHLGLDKSTITGIVTQGEVRGLMRRVADAHDARSTRVELTDAGHALARACEREVATAVGPLVTELRRRL
jgi:DNA-binding MarR family transcriptional regulator